MNIKEIAVEIYKNAVDKGFYSEPVEVGTRLMLTVSELAEALEADRKGRWFKGKGVIKEKITVNNFADMVKDTVEDEIADAVIRMFDFAEHYGIDLEWHIRQKMNYNATREFKHGKKY